MAATREQILVAALDCLGRYGFRRTSIDTIAKAAGVSRPTVYQYFAGKEQILRAVGGRVLDNALAEAYSVAVSDAPLTERIHGALNAKFRLAARQSERGFRADLIAETAVIAGDLLATFHERLTRIVAGVLASVPHQLDLEAVGLTPAEAAQLLLDATAGIEQADAPALVAQQRLRRLVDVTLRGLARRRPVTMMAALCRHADGRYQANPALSFPRRDDPSRKDPIWTKSRRSSSPSSWPSALTGSARTTYGCNASSITPTI